MGCGGVPSRQTAVTGNPTAPTSSESGTSASSSPPADATIISNIQAQPNWSSCTACANIAGNALYSMTESISTPSISGSAAEFSITGGTPWSSALWWKHQDGDDSATHFVLDLYYYVTDAKPVWALEYNVVQQAGGFRYEFATQCDIAEGTWRVWDRVDSKWIATTAPCTAPATKQWNHVVWEFQRDSSNQVIFVAVNSNGQRSIVDIAQQPTAASSSGIDVAFQMDTNGTPDPYSVWLDKVTLTYW